jgi:LysR family transcriptional activator of nhaA
VDWLNYHHLLYFWVTVREGGVARAARALHVSQPTISAQIGQLEKHLGDKLFRREGRTLVPTELGRVVSSYAEQIFALGRELLDVTRGRVTGQPVRLLVGVADSVPKLIAYRVLAPAFELAPGVRLHCREADRAALFAELSTHGLDMVLADAPLGLSTRVRAFSHLLGECGVDVFATRALRKRLGGPRARFPRLLHGAPTLLPLEGTALRRDLDAWFERHAITPQVVGEFADSALIKAFGQAGEGVFFAPSAIAADLQAQGLQRLGAADEVRERYYAISIERKIKHPAVLAITSAARSDLFAR